MAPPPDLEAFDRLAESVGIDVEAMHRLGEHFEPLDAVRHDMAAVELFRTAGVDFINPWLSELHRIYELAFGKPHEVMATDNDP